MMITCERTRALLSLYVLGDLRPDAAAAIAAHVATCADCRQEYERIRATVASLRDALAQAPDAPPRLSEDRRRQVLATMPGGLFACRPVTPRPEFWLARHHRGLAVAAGLLVVLGLLWPTFNRMERLAGSNKLARFDPLQAPQESAREDLRIGTIEGWLENNESDTETAQDDSRRTLISQPEVGRAFLPDREALDSQPGMAGLPRPPEQLPDKYASGPVSKRSALSRAANQALEKKQPVAASMPTDRLRAQHDPKLGEAFKAELPEPAELPFSPAPAEFDSIAMTRSPVVMRGLYGSRPPEEAGRKREEREQMVGGMADESESQSGIGGGGRVKDKHAESALSLVADAPDLSDGIPVIGRLFTARSSNRKEAGAATAPTDSGYTQKPQPKVGRAFLPDPEALDSQPGMADFKGLAEQLPRAEGEERLPSPSTRRAGRVDEDAASRLVQPRREAASTLGSRDVLQKRQEAEAVEVKGATTARATPTGSARKQRERTKSGADEMDGELRSKPRARAYGVNPFQTTAVEPLSTFSIDVDTASYTMARRYMHQGVLPPAELVRTEEFVNAFDYGYRAPTHATFRIDTELAPSPFGAGLHLLKIGVKGRRLGREEERPAVLTLVIDTSGSMNQPDRLELAQASLRLLIERLGPRDRVAVIQYDSHARVALDYTPATRKTDILAAIDGLQCRGSTNLEEAMQQAYALAVRAFVPGAENRVILLSDGVANMGADSAEAILGKVAANRRQGITCSVLGFGMGSYDDAMLESLANKGDGVYSFIDSLDQARRIFVDDLAATLNTIARDVKIQVQFNPAWVVQHRQLGYENRQLAHRDFRNDAVDAGEVGSGQSVTALYECELHPAARTRDAAPAANQPVATVRVRYRRVATGAVEELRHDVWPRDVRRDAGELSTEFRLAACVAEFAEILRGSPFALGSEFEAIARLLRPVALELHLDTRVQELLRLVHAAGSLGTAPGVDDAP